MILSVHALTVQFPGGPQLGPLSLQVEAGLYHLTGPNGVGKTSLLRAIAGANPRSAGSVRVHGMDPEREARARRHIGYVSTRPELPAFLTVEEAWRMMAALRNRPDWSGVELADQLALDGNVQLGRASSGMRRKAELVAALAGAPDVLLLDETLANLDDAAVDVVGAWLTSWASNRVILLTHHGPLPHSLTASVTRIELALPSRP